MSSHDSIRHVTVKDMISSRPVHAFLILSLFVSVTVALDHCALDAPMYYDSAARLKQNEHVFARGLQDTLGIFPQRPVAMVTFYLNYLACGLRPHCFRLVNAGLMALTALMLAELIALLLGIADPGYQGTPRERKAVGLLLAGLFVIHPLQSYVVVYIWQRMALLASLFYLSSLLAYLLTRSGRIRNRTVGYALSLTMFFLALASKENAVSLPAVLILVEVAFFKRNYVSILKRGVAVTAVLVCFLVLLSLLERPHGLGEASGIFDTVSRYYRESGLTLYQVALSQCRILFSYFEMIVLPIPSTVRLFSPQVVSRSLFEPPATIVAVGCVLVFLAAGFYLLRKRPLTGFGLLFFFVNLVPESVLVPQYLFLGYRATLPMVGLLLAAADGISVLLERTRETRVWKEVCMGLAVAFAGAAAGLIWVSVSKAGTWQNPALFWGEVVASLPSADRNRERHPTRQALNGLGLHFQDAGRLTEAIELHRRALRSDPKDGSTLVYLANAYARAGNLSQANAYVKKALKANPRSAEAHMLLGRILAREGRIVRALDHFGKGIALEKNNPAYHLERGILLLRQGKAADSLSSLRAAARLDPISIQAHYSLGKALMKCSRIPEAMVHFGRTLALEPDHWQAHNDMGVILARAGRLEEAERHFRTALRRNPHDVPTSRNLQAVTDQIRAISGEGPVPRH